MEQDHREYLAAYVEEKRAPRALARFLEELSPPASCLVRDLIEAVNPSANALRGLLRLADEIGVREEKKLEEVLDAAALRELAAVQGKSRKEKQKLLREELERMRFPELARVKARLEQLQQELLQSFGVRIELPPDFEGDQVSVKMVMSKPEDFRRAGRQLVLLADDLHLRELFSLLEGEW